MKATGPEERQRAVLADLEAQSNVHAQVGPGEEGLVARIHQKGEQVLGCVVVSQWRGLVVIEKETALARGGGSVTKAGWCVHGQWAAFGRLWPPLAAFGRLWLPWATAMRRTHVGGVVHALLRCAEGRRPPVGVKLEDGGALVQRLAGTKEGRGVGETAAVPRRLARAEARPTWGQSRRSLYEWIWNETVALL